jgi:hypothetical protein
MPDKYWNYPSSKAQQIAELKQMHKAMTDPEERRKQKLLNRREGRRAQLMSDTGI